VSSSHSKLWQALDLRASGRTIDDIISQLNLKLTWDVAQKLLSGHPLKCHAKIYAEWVKKNGEAPTKYVDPTTKNKIFAMKANGVVQAKIAKELGVSEAFVSRLLKGDLKYQSPYRTTPGDKRLKYPIKRTNKISDKKISAVLKMRRCGVTYDEISEIVGISHATIWKICSSKRRLNEV
jgi:DNA invertase Pin-like site-specific DNA recombinase